MAVLSEADAVMQRAVLDLLLGELAVDAPFFRADRPDERDSSIALVAAVFGTLLRRDISLTKCMHAWLLGGKDAENAVAFCSRYSKHFVLDAINDETKAALRAIAVDAPKVATCPRSPLGPSRSR